MGFKSLLTIVNRVDLATSALDAAIQAAAKMDAHLDILAIGVDQTQMGYYYAGANAVVMQENLHRAQDEAMAIETAIKARMQGETIPWSSETIVAQLGGMGHIVSQRARFSDLVILPKPYGENCGPEDETIIEAAMFDGQAPVIVLPSNTNFGKNVVVAWNQSNEAMTAIRAALPLLQAADMVNIAIIDPPPHGPERSDPGGALSQWLSRQGVHPEISVLAKTMPRVADVLARHATDICADLVVMGAYGHSRFREAILGGATRHTLEASEVPVFLAH
ncbi:universal stress protein [Actibacterium pelagium]|uniref:Universal stress protein n=1 Tax=Actibacterium pelagium TaxID=2029103 RepID=A0A917EIU8_9RHOB|nr:universal stress protein [Actibacterium pelagium]GGE50220.1 universal stress protein [Actibacterium pelagium]